MGAFIWSTWVVVVNVRERIEWWRRRAELSNSSPPLPPPPTSGTFAQLRLRPSVRSPSALSPTPQPRPPTSRPFRDNASSSFSPYSTRSPQLSSRFYYGFPSGR